MALNQEYKRKVEVFIDKFPKRMYHAIGEVTYTGFFTFDHLNLEEAMAQEKQPMPQGLSWGLKWQYGWFFAEIVVPKEADGKRVLFEADLGECLVFLNGKVVGAFDQQHSHITLTNCAKAGEVYHIAMEVYAGHNGSKHSRGTLGNESNAVILIPEENITDFPEDVNQKVVKNGTIGHLSEDVFQLWMDMKMLYDLRNNLEEDSLRRAQIDRGLKKVCDAVDVETDFAVFEQDAVKGREILKPLMECKNGSTAPLFYAIGNSHLDLEWVWTVNETKRKTARTLGNQLELMKEYPEYKYTQSQAWILDNVKNLYPELYERVKEAVKNGNIIIEGGMWVQSDTNLPSGESLIRQFLVGKKFFKDEFGVESELFWLPDSFGASGNLPQILKGCGVNYFVSCKIPWLYNEGSILDVTTFDWQGIDGSKVLAHIPCEYPIEVTPSNAFKKWHENSEKENIPVKMFTYGWGDGGGGATREHLEALRRAEDLEGMPKMVPTSPIDFFKDVEEKYEVEKTFVGELYYAVHRGTYTSQAKTKKYNRQAEFALREAEMWSALYGIDSAKAGLDGAWKDVLFNQFHDIIPGSSIQAVHERAEASYLDAMARVDAITKDVVNRILESKDNQLTVFNSLSWDRTTQIALPEGYTSLSDTEGNTIATEKVGEQVLATVTIPACGMKSFVLGNAPVVEAKKGDGLVLENAYIRATFNQKGEMISLFDKEKKMEFLSEPSNVFKLYQDMPTFCDAWDIDSFYEKVEVPLADATIEPEYQGELLSSLVITKKINQSELKQRVILRKNSRRLDFETTVDWKETHRFLMAHFYPNVHTEELVSEIQFGYAKRPTHRNKQYDQDRFEVCQHKWSALCEGKRGFAVLNDSKYGVGAEDNNLHLSLLKAGACPDMHADKGIQTFTYSVMPFTENLADSDVVREGYELNAPVLLGAGMAEEKSFLTISEKNVIIDNIKLAEDGSGDLIIRLYECQNSYTNTKVSFGFDVKCVCLTNMIEEGCNKLNVEDNSVEVSLRGFEIVTLRVKR